MPSQGLESQRYLQLAHQEANYTLYQDNDQITNHVHAFHRVADAINYSNARQCHLRNAIFPIKAFGLKRFRLILKP